MSLEVSPLLADDTAGTIEAAAQTARAGAARQPVHQDSRARRAGIPAIEESIFAGVPINVTLLFSREQYLAAAEAYMRGIERRIAAGLDPRVGRSPRCSSAAGTSPSRTRCRPKLRNRLGIAIGQRTYKAYRELLASPRWQKLAAAGAQPQRLLWASTGTKDPAAPDTLYIEALAAPDTINTMPEKTLLAFADHGQVTASMPADGGDAEAVLARVSRKPASTIDALAAQLQQRRRRSVRQVVAASCWSASPTRARQLADERRTGRMSRRDADRRARSGRRSQQHSETIGGAASARAVRRRSRGAASG